VVVVVAPVLVVIVSTLSDSRPSRRYWYLSKWNRFRFGRKKVSDYRHHRGHDGPDSWYRGHDGPDSWCQVLRSSEIWCHVVLSGGFSDLTPELSTDIGGGCPHKVAVYFSATSRPLAALFQKSSVPAAGAVVEDDRRARGPVNPVGLPSQVPAAGRAALSVRQCGEGRRVTRHNSRQTTY
jgi:hypothetical protein